MSLESINYIAQTMGVLAIVVSLVFVGIQVRQNSAQIEANTRSIMAPAGIEATHSWAATKYEAQIGDCDALKPMFLGIF